MAVVSRRTWLEREVDYRTGTSVEDMAARHGVSPHTAHGWARDRDWAPVTDESALLRARLELELMRAEQDLSAGRLDVAGKRLRVLAGYMRLRGQLTQMMADGERMMADDGPDSGCSRHGARALEELCAEIERRLDQALGQAETKSVPGGADDEDDGCGDGAGFPE